MKKAVRSMISTIIAVVIVISCFMVPVCAESMETIEFDDFLVVDRECNGSTQYKLKVKQSAIYYIEIETLNESQEDCDFPNIYYSDKYPYCHFMGNDGEVVVSFTRLFERKSYLKTISNCYLKEGEYIFYIDSTCLCSVYMWGFDGDVYITKDGERMDYDLCASSLVHSYIRDSSGHKYELVVKFGSRGQSIDSYSINIGSKVKIGSNTPKDYTVSIDMYEDCSFSARMGNTTYSLGVWFTICSDISDDNFKNGTKQNVLVDKGENVMLDFTCDHLNGVYICAASGGSKHAPYMESTIDYPDVFYAEGHYVTAMKHFFIKDTTAENILALNKEYEVSPALFSCKTTDSQVVYSYTPEKDGTYHLTSTGWRANPYVAVFDSNDNCIGWYDNNFDVSEIGLESFRMKEIDYHLDLKIDLKADETYYFYFTNSYTLRDRLVTIEYETSVPFNIKLTEYTEPKTEIPKQDSTTPSSPSTPEISDTLPAQIESGLSFGDFVERLYVVALNRQSEPEGKAFWCEHVGNGDLNGAQCANEFLLSKEFNDRNLSNEEFLRVLYKTFFDRDAANDPDGFNFWMNSLKTEGRDKVVDGFINSVEWCNICASYGVKSGATRAKATVASENATAFATRLYTCCLGREPEDEGLKFWSLGLTNLEVSGYEAAKQFFESAEFKGFNTSNEDYLRRLYTTFMGREADTDGLNFWLKAMNDGMSREQVLNEFAKSKEFTEICNTYAINRGI